MKFENLTGQRFVRLVVTSQAESNKHGHTKWNCKCDCGNEVIAYASDLKRGGRPSCGCLKSEKISALRRLEPGHAGLNQIFGQYKKSAKERRVTFHLTYTQFSSLIAEQCHYCGSGPTLRVFSENRMSQRNVNGNFTYTGIDRKNSDEGYHIENCVTCCKTCNFAKNSMSYVDFVKYLDTLVSYRVTIHRKEAKRNKGMI
jgi:hypothetical protein